MNLPLWNSSPGDTRVKSEIAKPAEVFTPNGRPVFFYLISVVIIQADSGAPSPSDRPFFSLPFDSLCVFTFRPSSWSYTAGLALANFDARNTFFHPSIHSFHSLSLSFLILVKVLMTLLSVVAWSEGPTPVKLQVLTTPLLPAIIIIKRGERGIIETWHDHISLMNPFSFLSFYLSSQSYENKLILALAPSNVNYLFLSHFLIPWIQSFPSLVIHEFFPPSWNITTSIDSFKAMPLFKWNEKKEQTRRRRKRKQTFATNDSVSLLMVIKLSN